MKVAELYVLLGFKSDETKLKDFVHSMGELNLSSVLASLGLGTTLNMMKKILDAATEGAVKINALGKETGQSSQFIQRFGNYAQRMGSNVDEANTFIENYRKNLTKIAVGEGNLRPFMLSGIAPSEDLEKNFQEFNKFFNNPKIDNRLKMMVQEGLGMSANMRNAFQQSQAVFGSMNDDQNIISESQIKAALSYKTAWEGIKQTFGSVGNQIATEVMPNLEKLYIEMGKQINQLKVIPGYFRSLMDFTLGLAALAGGPWAMLGYVIYMLATHFKQLADNAKEFIETIKKIPSFGMNLFPSFNPLSMAAGLGNNIVQMASGGKTENRFTFHVSGNGAMDIAIAVENIIKKHFGNADYQSPLENH